ncbi:hypothetical protein, partial [Pseudomonas paraeruginosa]|uniref:hypothetical protein n=1 Tax=Pseudomonas paraeruginosa TaxID=2994495 RepID=UPI003FD1692C
MPVPPLGFLQALEEVGVRDAQRGNLLVLLADLSAQRADQCVIGGLCSGQPIPDSGLSFSSATAGG